MNKIQIANIERRDAYLPHKIPSNAQLNANENKEIGLQKIVCGVQTGVDHTALDAAILLDFEYDGWSPQGRPDEALGEKSYDYLIKRKY